MARKGRKRDEDEATNFLDSLLFKLGSKLLLGILIVIAFLTLAQCTVKTPESPTWSTDFVVPVVNRTYTMDELVSKADQDGVFINDSGEVAFSISEDLDTVALDPDNLSTGDLAYRFAERLGPVALDPPTVAPVEMSLASIDGMPPSLPGDSAVVPDMSFDVTSDMPTFTEFGTATFSTGTMEVVVTNELGLQIDNIALDITDAGTNTVLMSGTYGPALPSGSVATVPFDLAGVTLPSEVNVVGRYHTPGGVVTDLSSRYIRTEVTFPGGPEVISATAKIPPLLRTDSSLVALAESDRIDSAQMSSGAINVTIDNHTSLDADLVVTVPDIVQGSSPLQLFGAVAGRGSAILSADLTQYTLMPRSSTVPQEVTVIVTATLPGSGDTQVPVDQADSFLVQAEVTNLTFSRVSGLFQTVSATFDSVAQDVDVPTGFDAIELTDAVLTLEIENAIDLPGVVDVQLAGNNGKTLSLTGDVTPRGLATSATTTIINESVADFLAPVPTHLEANGTVTFGDGAYEGTITANDYVFARVRIDAPLEMVINPTVVDTDIEREEIDQDNIRDITDHFIEGRFVYRLTSHLPIGAHVNVFLGPDSAGLFTAPQLRFDSLYLAAAPVGANGIVTDTVQTDYQEIYLDSIDIRVLENPILYVGQQLVLHGSEGQVVKLMNGDYITVTGRLEVEYLFDGEF